jgi:hypothetical protein
MTESFFGFESLIRRRLSAEQRAMLANGIEESTNLPAVAVISDPV